MDEYNFEIAPHYYVKLLDRQLFLSLVRTRKGEYMLLNDLNFIGYIFALDDADAVKQFREYINR